MDDGYIFMIEEYSRKIVRKGLTSVQVLFTVAFLYIGARFSEIIFDFSSFEFGVNHRGFE